MPDEESNYKTKSPPITSGNPEIIANGIKQQKSPPTTSSNSQGMKHFFY